MGIQEEILNARNVLEKAEEVVTKGLSIFERVADTFDPQVISSEVPATQTNSPVSTSKSSIFWIVLVIVALFLLMKWS